MNDYGGTHLYGSDWLADSRDNILKRKELNAEIKLHCNHESELTHCIMIYKMRNITNEKGN